MSWNNAAERNMFNKREEKFVEEARKNGMSEDNIAKIVSFDEEVFNGDRRYYERSVSISLNEETDQPEDDMDTIVSYAGSNIDDHDIIDDITTDWMDKIGDENLYKSIMKLNGLHKRIIELFVVEGLSQEEIAYLLNMSQGSVSKYWRYIKKKLRRDLKKQRSVKG